MESMPTYVLHLKGKLPLQTDTKFRFLSGFAGRDSTVVQRVDTRQAVLWKQNNCHTACDMQPYNSVL